MASWGDITRALIWTLVTQSLAFRSGSLPGVSARTSHLNNPAAFLAMQPVLPARHFACWADAGAAGKSSSTVTSGPDRATRDVPLRRAAIKEMEDGQADASTRNNQRHH